MNIHDSMEAMENNLSAFISKSQAEYAALDRRVKETLRNFEEHRLTAWEWERPPLEVVKTDVPKKRLWGRIFG